MKTKSFKYRLWYTAPRWDAKQGQHVIETVEDVGRINHSNELSAEKEVREMFKWFFTPDAPYQYVRHEIIEEGIESTINIEGIISDNGLTYEDYAVIIKEKDKEAVMIEHLLGQYMGRKVKINIEILD